MRFDSANERVDRSVAKQIERQDNREGTSKGEKKDVPHDPPTLVRVLLVVPLSSGTAEPVEPVSSVCVSSRQF